MNNLRLPGLTDPHVHLREPGQTQKEDFSTGTAAALAGGFTTVLAMPNTQPPITTLAVLADVRRSAAANTRCDIGLFVGANLENAAALPKMAVHAVGLKVYLNDTFGPLRVNELAALLNLFAAWPGPGPIAVHAEDITVSEVLGLVAITGQRVHFCHISERAELVMVAKAKEKGLPVTCEVTPHHLFLNKGDADRLGAFGQMKPMLRSETDRLGLWELLDYVDCVASDHAPHTRAEKQGATPPPGIPGLETALPLMLTALEENRLSLERLIDLMSRGPRRIFGLPDDDPQTWVDVDTTAVWTLPDAHYYTKCAWSPFAGRSVRGKINRVVLRGREVYTHGVVTAAPGIGQLVR
jgi:dihydroorotase